MRMRRPPCLRDRVIFCYGAAESASLDASVFTEMNKRIRNHITLQLFKEFKSLVNMLDTLFHTQKEVTIWAC